MTSVKICGLVSEEQVLAVASLPVDHIGFVFARSKRQVTPVQAGAWIRRMKEARGDDRPLAAGVFVNFSREELAAVLEEAPLDVVQLHGQEDAAYCRWLKEAYPGLQIFKVITLTGGAGSRETSPELVIQERLQSYQPYVDGILLDTFDPVYGGGSGKTFAWEAIPPYQAWCREAGVRLIVAGGLNPDNVNELLESYRPDGVDVSSGVETEGMKDMDKITSFVGRVKRFV
ncbi:phosphoribosylanthranilate isomerase [Paenibacillus filicis]|uniref:N-(5'-phosphoribosyl)anthranilate isomerase n=1 Tax=Paenibacillus gyeongsangnamensis TaxID=3388067 RepID=A0ABT4Q7V5_9BACL|nr:phosphoribosylanthranilate isomerase [Paenibacillus filicis]MCZ8512952.1 phosphoribosylanthranilate isomerase [Paenibacillus filicis]